jgi:ribonuclease E
MTRPALRARALARCGLGALTESYMPKRMLIDASHPEETRVVVLDGNKVEEFDFEAASRRPLKGNIYLAKVTRVEPSLQAAFVEYGGNRQGFLAFTEIHPDYYQIPVADRLAILAAQAQRMMADDDFDAVDTTRVPAQEPMVGSEEEGEQADQPAVERPEDIIEAAPEQSGARDESEEQEEEPEESTSQDGDVAEEDSRQDDGAENSHAEASPAAEESNDAETRDDSSPAVLESGDAEFVGATEEDAQDESVTVEQTPDAEERHNDVQAEATGAPVAYQRRERRPDRPRPPRRRQYKIQEVIKRRQVMLVQVVKEERGTKGASLTTFLSLAGRYCVLMPNTPRGGGISRKITNATDRKRLKSAAQSLELPEGMGLIIRTAGANRTKLEIKRDYEYLLRLWDTVRELTLKSNAPALVYEEGSLIKRAIRDLYSKDISEIVVDGDLGYRDAKDFMRMLMPSHAKNVKPYKEVLPLFQRYHVESQLDAMFSPVVHLRSGGYIVINQTEALVSIDVNSGKATREHSIEETAHKTNLEAADEIARQLRLRDLAGLIVIDFIDMEDGKNDRNVEKRLHNAVRNDRARIQIGKISQFGLLEMSRQRLRAGVLAGSTVTCPHCAGMGLIRSTESAALRLLRALDEEGQNQPSSNVTVKAPSDVTIYTLNQKRREILRIEEAYDLAVSFEPQASMMGGSFELERSGVRAPSPRPKAPVSVDAGFAGQEPADPAADVTIVEAPVETEAATASSAAAEGAQSNGQGAAGEGKRRRRRRRRGGRGRDGQDRPHEGGTEHRAGPPQQQRAPLEREVLANEAAEIAEEDHAGAEDEEPLSPSTNGGGEGVPASSQPQSGEGGRRRRRRRGRRGRRREGEFGTSAGAESPAGASPAAAAPGIPDDAGAPEKEIVPNTPSSPQWSLTDQAGERASAPVSQAELVDVAPRTEAKGRDREPERERASVAAGAPVLDHPPVDDTPRETRKGWWQRRFKI